MKHDSKRIIAIGPDFAKPTHLALLAFLVATSTMAISPAHGAQSEIDPNLKTVIESIDSIKLFDAYVAPTPICGITDRRYVPLNAPRPEWELSQGTSSSRPEPLPNWRSIKLDAAGARKVERGSPEAMVSFFAQKSFIGDNEPSCRQVPRNLRVLFIENALERADRQGGNISEHDIRAISLRLGRVPAVRISRDRWLGESNGDTTNVNYCPENSTDCHDNQASLSAAKRSRDPAIIEARKHDYKPDPNMTTSTLQRYRKSMWGLQSIGVVYNHETDFGLPQLSYDRTYHVPSIFNKVKKGFYKVVTAGHYDDHTISSDDACEKISNPAERTKCLFTRFQNIARRSPSEAVLACGTQLMFEEGKTREGMSELAAEMDKIKSCTLCEGGKCQPNPSRQELECWGNWMALCPQLGIQISVGLGDEYFGTKGMDSFRYDRAGNYIGKGGPKEGRCFGTIKSAVADYLEKHRQGAI